MKEGNQYSGHRHRLREKFMAGYGKGMHDYECLELLLTYAIARKDVKPIAKNLLERFKSLNGVLDADPHEIEILPNTGRYTSSLIKLVKEMGSLYLSSSMAHKDIIRSPESVIHFSRSKLSGLPHEAFMVLYLNVQNEVLCHDILNEGTIDQVAVYPRRIIEQALKYHAAGLIVVHNHPSGYTTPSDDDKTLTKAIYNAAALLNIRLLDHIIVSPLRFEGSRGFYSFLDHGLL